MRRKGALDGAGTRDNTETWERTRENPLQITPAENGSCKKNLRN